MASRRVELHPHEPARAGLARVLRAELAVVEAAAPGIVADTDPERLHEWRVAIRRSRSLLRAGDGVFADDELDRWGRALRRLIRRTGELRDLDVWVGNLDQMGADLHAEHRDDLELLRGFLVDERAASQEAVASMLEGDRYRHLIERWTAFLAEAESAGDDASGDDASGDDASGDGAPGDDGTGPSMLEAARRGLVAAHERVHALGQGLELDTPAERIHDLRKRAKDLRYQLESFAPLFDRAELVEPIALLKTLQDVLGQFQDEEVHLADIERFAERLAAGGPVAPAALLELGELRARLEDKQLSARSDVVDAMRAFDRPGVNAWFDGLGRD